MNKRTYKEERGLIPELFDTHRKLPKAQGGIYTPDNVEIHSPKEHMILHGIYREREEKMEALKEAVDARRQVIKLKNKIENQIRAMHRGTDTLDPETETFLNATLEDVKQRLKEEDKRVKKALKNTEHPLLEAVEDVQGVGPVTMAAILTYVDIEKAKHASSLWSYCGLHKPSHDRYTKGESGGGNKTLRTMLYNTASSMIKCRSVYRDVYDMEKQKLSNSRKIVKSRNTKGKLVEVEWQSAKPSHRHGAAMRKMIKHFLADLWFVWREIEGLSTRPLYVEEKMGHTGIIQPQDRGWKIPPKVEAVV